MTTAAPPGWASALVEHLESAGPDECLNCLVFPDRPCPIHSPATDIGDVPSADMGVTLAANKWKSNAELIEEAAGLYLRQDLLTLDPTYGRGVWYKNWRPFPEVFVYHDLYRGDGYDVSEGEAGIDFRAMPYPDCHFWQVLFDPPYVCMGGRKTTGIPDFYDGYGLDNAPDTPEGLQEMIDAGLTECRRVIKPTRSDLPHQPRLFVKCQDYITSGKFWPGTFYTMRKAVELGFTPVDRFEHLGRVRPQAGDSEGTQVHARRNLSTLMVFNPPAVTGTSLFD